MSEQEAEYQPAEIAVIEKNGSILISPKGLDYADFAGLWRLSKMIHIAKMFPRGLESPEAICIAIAKGRSVGITDPFQAVESIAVINGRACLYGDAPIAVARQHPAWQEKGFDEFWEVKGKRIEGNPSEWTEDVTAVCVTQRKHGKPKVSRFSVSDARRAKLWGKDGPWTFYPGRMLMYRARGFNLRDNFGDSLKGLAIRELYEGDELSNGDHSIAKVADLNEKIKEKQAQIEVSQKPQEAPETPEPPAPPPEPEKQPPNPKPAKDKPPSVGTMKNQMLPLIAQLPTQEERAAFMALVFKAKTIEELTTLQRQIKETISPPPASSSSSSGCDGDF